jgi:hypothetical protein
MRPTIPIVHWKIAVDLEETRRIQRNPGMLATNCECNSCRNWRLVWDEVLPEKIIHQLSRIGIAAKFPSDSYGYGEQDGVESFRVWFHAIGKILSGPNGWIESNISGETILARNYVVVRDDPLLSLVIQPCQEFVDPPPKLDGVDLKDLIQIDFRLITPHRRQSKSLTN